MTRRWISSFWRMVTLAIMFSMTTVWPRYCTADESIVAGEDGLFRRSGDHVRLVTDIADDELINEWVESFDAAVPQWAAFWGIDARSLADWSVDAHVMREPRRFIDNGLLPRRLAGFPFGTADGNRIWIHEQPSRYYNRHLLLHEGVHALMFQSFGGAGPAWFMEGTAELLSVHAGSGRRTVVGGVPVSREAAAEWGRFKILSKRRDEGNVKTIEEVMRLPRRLRGDVESYGWSWLAVSMLSQYPEYRDEVVRAARQEGSDASSGFTRKLYQRLFKQWPVVRARWAMMNLDIDYGFDWTRQAIDIGLEDPPLASRSVTMSVASDQGWQSAGYRFPAGTSVELAARGAAELDNTTRPWMTLPGGITIKHFRGQPIGRLVACVLPVRATDVGRIDLPKVIPVGERGGIEIDEESWLLLQVNDAVDDRWNNRGSFQVELKVAD